MPRKSSWLRCGAAALAFGVVGLSRLLAQNEALLHPESDPYRWLEDIDSPRALEWVRTHNAATAQRLTTRADYAGLYRDALAVLDSKSRIPKVTQRGNYLYNLWRDRDHPRGLYQRVSVAGFRSESPAWETVLDVDALARQESKPWAFGGVIWRKGDLARCLIRLAPSGGDASEVREFDLQAKAFVPQGFWLPAAKSRVSWAGRDALWVATDFGPGSLTSSGYPAQVKFWRRGTPLAAAQPVYHVPTTAVGVAAAHWDMTGAPIDLVSEEQSFWEHQTFQWRGGQLQPLALPLTATIVDAREQQLIIWLKSDWAIGGAHYPSGAVVIADLALLRGEPGRSQLVVAPGPDRVIASVDATPQGVLVGALDNVRGRLYRCAPGPTGWTAQAVVFPDNGALNVATTDEDSGEAWIDYQSFLTPPSLYFLGADSATPELVKAQTPTFDAARFAVVQYHARSADGTAIPYFVVQPRGLKLDGTAPVWMFSYGGFEISLTPAYSGSYEDLHGAYGKLWLERGGVFVLANIRGGGEFGPAWHQGALLENHLKALEDFEAVAADLSARRITSPAHLGIEGRSNGGLLVSATMVRHPELYGAVVCGNPLIDMYRYQHLLAGASWIAEYGDPDRPEQWAFLRKYSPYQNVQAGMRLPPVLFYTTTHDDRVHPGHARKMAAKMEALGYPIDYAENTEGGHHGSVTNQQLATRLALTYTFLWEHVGGARPPGAL